MHDVPWLWLVAAALWLEFFIRWPNRIAHPVVALGALIGALDRRWNLNQVPERTKRWRGVVALLVVVIVAASVGLVVQCGLAAWVPTFAPYLCALVGVLGLAAGSLYQHFIAIQRPLSRNDLEAARHAVSMIVGRDTATMDAYAISAAALESLAESFNDGVVAPVFWFAIGGLPALFTYKAINTADSMIGHMEPRWRAFGWAAAKTDDIANWIPARIAGVLIAIASAARGSTAQAMRVMLKDASKHASPNAGWTEAAMAGALGVRLGGAVHYDGVLCERPSFGDGPAPTAMDMKNGAVVYLLAFGLLTITLVLGGALWRL
ncbi:adenosylcobinamide-phosphate synthase CbiB [uncultured Brevundimonas sp.]|uniref:adenosylcobinamide-phosphate synthase CbiB n=1 Tax=uncultured Brevundimonas sp. TaxID=213418 RepID=UPI002617081A|nr:adenosylcobinamide-phosphate synthase CbiB [uncultured Brevundimonas sp.]